MKNKSKKTKYTVFWPIVFLASFYIFFTKDTTFWKAMWNTGRIGIVGFEISIILKFLLMNLLSNLPIKNLPSQTASA